ncbi:hypothetical protein JCM33774_74240 [Actinophytocola sp. KF-1]
MAVATAAAAMAPPDGPTSSADISALPVTSTSAIAPTTPVTCPNAQINAAFAVPSRCSVNPTKAAKLASTAT